MKWISSILVAALLLHVGYMPCAAEEPVTPKRDEIERSKFKMGMYVEVTYCSEKGKKEAAKGYIKAVEDDAIVIRRGLWKKRIAYRDIIDIIDLTTKEQKAKNRKQKALMAIKVVPSAVILKGDEIDRTKLKAGWYVEVTYYSEKRIKKTAKGRLQAVKDDAFILLYYGRSIGIKYGDIITLMVGRSKRDIDRLKAGTSIVPGARIRIISAGSPPLTGTFMSMDADTLVIKSESGRQLSIPLASSTRLALRLGRKSNVGKGARIGFLVGATSGVILGSMVGETDSELWPSPGEAARALGLVFGVLGTFVGAVIGSIIGDKERWNEVPLPVHLDIQSQRQGGMMLSASFTF